MISPQAFLGRAAALLACALALTACNGQSSGPSTVALSAAKYSVAQNAGSASLTVMRNGAATTAISVAYATSSGTAVAGTNFTPTSGTLNWAENDSTAKTITVPIDNATPFSGSMTFEVALSDPSAGAFIAGPGSATVSIAGDGGTAGNLELSAATYSVAQTAGPLTVTVNRTDGSFGAVTVNYATANGTAVAGTDYTAATGTLKWADGDASAKTLSIAVSNANSFTGNKTFTVALSGATGGAGVSTPTSSTVTITGGGSPPVGSLQLSAASYPVAQGAGTVTVTVNRTGGSSGAISLQYATANGTAAAGTDYTAANGTLQWADGDATAKTFPITISNATPFSGNKTFTVALSKPSATTTIANPGTATVTIAGDAVPAIGSVELSAASYTVAQTGGTVPIKVNRTGGSSGAVSVNYTTANGTAVSGTDYTAASGTLQWTDGDTSAKTISVAISNKTPFSGNKSFTVTLSTPGGGATLSSPSTAGVTISGSTPATIGSLQVSAATYTVAQTAGTVTVTVNRTGGSSGAISVAFATANGTATAGRDYTAANGTLSWASGDANAKTFSVPVSNATPFTGSRSFTVAISSPSGGATLSTPSSASVTISGSAPAAVGSVVLSASTYSVAQSGSTLTITVNRTGGSNDAISVAYATANGTAMAGTDYTATSGTLNWASGDASAKTFSVPISNATPFTGNKSFTITLSNPGDGATVGTPSSATATITGSGSPPAGGGSGGPSAVGNLQLVNQGGPHNTDPNNGNASNNYQAIKWDAATAGADAVDHYNIYRNGTLYATQTTQTVFQGYISGTTLTVTGVTSGTVLPGVRYSASGVLAETFINANQISGTTGAAGTYQVNRSQTLGSSSSPVSFSAWQYIDSNATNSNSITFSQPTTAYLYSVAAVDTQGNVGPQASQMSVYVYQNGFSNWNNYDLSYGGVVGANENYASTAGNPQGGPFDISVFYLNGGFQPASYGPQAPVDDLEIGAFNYMVMDVNPGPTAGYALQMGSESRLPPGDDGHWQGAGLNVFSYGPTPVANTWATYKIPLTAMGFGTCTFTGSISGTTLTVTAVGTNKGACVDSDGFITGANVPSGTYVTNYNQSSSIGTFTIAGPGISGSTSVPSGAMTWQRTNMYKFGSQTSTNQTQVYMNNIRFTVN